MQYLCARKYYSTVLCTVLKNGRFSEKRKKERDEKKRESHDITFQEETCAAGEDTVEE